MGEYNDWQVIADESQVLALNEYKKINSNKILSYSTDVDMESVFDKIEYLKSLWKILKEHNTNSDIDLVLEDIKTEIENSKNLLLDIFDTHSLAVLNQEIETKIFCNNLKLSIQVVLEILEKLSKITENYQKNDQIYAKIKQIYANFVNIAKLYVSLFGECNYRVFVKKYKK